MPILLFFWSEIIHFHRQALCSTQLINLSKFAWEMVWRVCLVSAPFIRKMFKKKHGKTSEIWHLENSQFKVTNCSTWNDSTDDFTTSPDFPTQNVDEYVFFMSSMAQWKPYHRFTSTNRQQSIFRNTYPINSHSSSACCWRVSSCTCSFWITETRHNK